MAHIQADQYQQHYDEGQYTGVGAGRGRAFFSFDAAEPAGLVGGVKQLVCLGVGCLKLDAVV
jgi:hypothetical protein